MNTQKNLYNDNTSIYELEDGVMLTVDHKDSTVVTTIIYIGCRCQPLITEIRSGYQPSITEIQCGSCRPSIIKIQIDVDHGKGKGE